MYMIKVFYCSEILTLKQSKAYQNQLEIVQTINNKNNKNEHTNTNTNTNTNKTKNKTKNKYKNKYKNKNKNKNDKGYVKRKLT